MVKGAASRVMSIGRTMALATGVAVMVAVVLGLASVAFGADGDFFKVGSSISTLVKSGAGPALNLRVDSGPPLRVNSTAKVANLNADRLDGQDASSLLTKGTSVISGSLGPLPKQSTFTSNGGPLLILASGSGWRPCSVTVPSGQPPLTQMAITLDGQTKGFATILTNECDEHHAFPLTPLLVSGVGAGTHTLKLEVGSSFTQTDSTDRFDAVVIELPAS